MENIKDLVLTVHSVEVVKNTNGGYIQLTLLDNVAKRVIKENFFLAPNTIKNTLTNLGFWLRNQVHTNDPEFTLPDPEYLAITAGKDSVEAINEVLKSAVEDLKTLIGKEIEVHQIRSTGFDRMGVQRNFVNLRPWKYQSASTDTDTEVLAETDFAGFL